MRTFKDGGPPPSGVDSRRLIRTMLAQLGDKDPPGEIVTRLLRTDSVVIGYLLRLPPAMATASGCGSMTSDSRIARVEAWIRAPGGCTCKEEVAEILRDDPPPKPGRRTPKEKDPVDALVIPRRCEVQDEDGNLCGGQVIVTHMGEVETDRCPKCGARWPIVWTP